MTNEKNKYNVELSINARKVMDYLNINRINYKTEYSFNDLRGMNNGLLRFDFAILDDEDMLLGIVEYDGEYHFENSNPDYDNYLLVSTHDKIKNNYCKRNGIPLLRISCSTMSNYKDSLYEFISTIGLEIKPESNDVTNMLKRREVIIKELDNVKDDDEYLDSLINELNSINYEINNNKKIWNGGKTKYTKSFTDNINKTIDNEELNFDELGFLLYLSSSFTDFEDNYLKVNNEYASKGEIIEYIISKIDTSEKTIMRKIKSLVDGNFLLTEKHPDNKRKNIYYLNPNLFYKGRYMDTIQQHKEFCISNK